jgi:hypothetical protein
MVMGGQGGQGPSNWYEVTNACQTEFVVKGAVWAVRPCILASTCHGFGGPAASIFSVQVGGRTLFRNFRTYYQTTRRYNPEDCILVFVVVAMYFDNQRQFRINP